MSRPFPHPRHPPGPAGPAGCCPAGSRSTRAHRYPSDTADAEWAVIEPLLPAPGWTRGLGGSPGSYCRRDIVDAVRYLTHNGPVWRALPADLPHWRTVYGHVRTWQASGATRRMHDTLREQVRVLARRGPQPTAAIIDSQSVKAADTVGKNSRGYDAGKKIEGRKRHLAVDVTGLILCVVITAASVQDRDGARPLLWRLAAGFRAVTLIWADGGYAGAFSMAWPEAGVEQQPEDDHARGRLAAFRGELYDCFPARADALFELADAVLCADGPVKTLAGLSLAPEHRRGHGALYDAVNAGRMDIGRLRRAVAGLPLPRSADGRLVLAVDVSNWLRPGAATSPERLFCHVYGRGKGQAQMIPGWPYSVVAALEPGRTSWTAVLDAVRLGPGDDETGVTAAQVRDVVTRLIKAGQHQKGDPDILVVFDAGYDVTRLAYLLADLPAQLLGRLRSDRVLYFPAPPRGPGANGRPSRHGRGLKLADPGTWPDPPVTTVTETTRYGTAVAQSWDRLHPRLTSRAAWEGHDGELPVIEGTLIRLTVDHLPGDRDPKPVWLWWSRTGASPAGVDRLWQAFLRRFDLEHTFRLFKQVLGWTAPKIRDPGAADRWTWLIIACHPQLRLARQLAADLRRPWERPAPPGRLTPARVRRGFRNIRATTTCPTGAPKPGKPGPGRPPGSKNRRPAGRHDVGKHTKADTANKQTG